jgi:hypothetical protein
LLFFIFIGEASRQMSRENGAIAWNYCPSHFDPCQSTAFITINKEKNNRRVLLVAFIYNENANTGQVENILGAHTSDVSIQSLDYLRSRRYSLSLSLSFSLPFSLLISLL